MADSARASSTLLSFSEPSMRQSGLQYHPPNISGSNDRSEPPPHLLDGSIPMRYDQRYPVQAEPYELPPQISEAELPPGISQRHHDGRGGELVEENKHEWSSAPFGVPPLKAATILVILAIFIVGAVVGGSVGRAVISKCSKPAKQSQRYSLPQILEISVPHSDC